MSSLNVVHALLTALFGGAALYAVRHALAADGHAWRVRVDHLLHAAMALAMAAMPWGPTPARNAQAVFFTVAALWFTCTPTRRPRESRPAALVRRLPSALGMAAMVWMLRTPHTLHHAPTAMTESRTGSPVTAALALCLLGCALRSLTRSIPALWTAAHPVGGLPRPYRHFWDGSMALGTAIMLIMPH
ncbi:DUF5134 domain-containing protein [Streptomyces kunmingensis]|uniref:DUF5134 domain-containing protein n=1 Tax=Streptomyces kunmingensis TaxID=68225 RepID=A0ABU6C880_9ACTN|nr:DUF5134 domain-containing protein [Streptomyces kunmingensis]MEB3960926.1 DUF5134 domain-containing protein [Streptomyces kunmingensis]